MSTGKELWAISTSSLTAVQANAIANYLPENFLPKVRNLKSITQVLENKTSSLAKISKNVGNEKAEALVKIYLNRTNELLDLRKPLSVEAMDEIAIAIVSDYYMLNMTDIVFVFQEALKGKYGEFYDSLNIPKVLKWFENYFNERCEVAERISDKERSSHNSLFGRERNSEQENEQRAFSRQYTINKMIEKQK